MHLAKLRLCSASGVQEALLCDCCDWSGIYAVQYGLRKYTLDTQSFPCCDSGVGHELRSTNHDACPSRNSMSPVGQGLLRRRADGRGCPPRRQLVTRQSQFLFLVNCHLRRRLVQILSPWLLSSCCAYFLLPVRFPVGNSPPRFLFECRGLERSNSNILSFKRLFTTAATVEDSKGINRGGNSSMAARMNRLGLAGAKFRRFFTRQTLFVAFAICLVWYLGMQFRNDSQHWSHLGSDEHPDLRTPPRRMPTHNVLPSLSERVLCHGPRGHLLGQSHDDDLRSRELDGRTKRTPRFPSDEDRTR
jgi:hypothetical protein